MYAFSTVFHNRLNTFPETKTQLLLTLLQKTKQTAVKCSFKPDSIHWNIYHESLLPLTKIFLLCTFFFHVTFIPFYYSWYQFNSLSENLWKDLSHCFLWQHGLLKLAQNLMNDWLTPSSGAAINVHCYTYHSTTHLFLNNAVKSLV